MPLRPEVTPYQPEPTPYETAARESVSYDTDGSELVDFSFFAHQHESYRRWRETDGGVHKVRFPGGTPIEGWLVTGYAACKAALTDPRLSKNSATEVFARRVGLSGEGPGKALTAHMLNSDPPHHTRLRKLVQKAYTMRRVAALRPTIEAHVDALLDALEKDADGGREVELISGFALPLPLAVVFDLFGTPHGKQAEFQVRGNTQIEGEGDGEVSVLTAETMLDHLRALIEDKRAHPADDLLSDLIAAREEGDRLTDEEITSMAFLLAVAGHQTTVNLIANGLHALLRHPAQLAALRADPSLVGKAVEEVLRYESPSGIASLRYTTEPVVIAGTTIPKGEFVQIALLAANRDPAVFTDPDRFDITRDDASRHLAFGHGIHRCLGAQLARLQAEIAFTRMLERFPDLRLAASDDEAETEEWQHNPRHHGLLALPVRLG
ncbi:cytochrome P450 [Streptomyces sp. NBC_00237]|uniref:cytochrome P450 family protein n=1 Tax=Streptomyces sp. NBC_00237 TaxID=2975687 RepID=UPI0022500253|nr:cytochrome P450 [Streptomyces sp. NBC_00237]MCX5206578.1 cytochrome P450 [Streptomyces sp. NBC_00237]